MRAIVLGFGLIPALAGPLLAAMLTGVLSLLRTTSASGGTTDQLGQDIFTPGVVVILVTVGLWMVGDRLGEHELTTPRRLPIPYGLAVGALSGLCTAVAIWLAHAVGATIRVSSITFSGTFIASLVAATALGADLAWIGALAFAASWLLSEDMQYQITRAAQHTTLAWAAPIVCCAGYVVFTTVRRTHARAGRGRACYWPTTAGRTKTVPDRAPQHPTTKDGYA